MSTGAVRVPLGHGLFALVDARDADRVLAKRWHAWRKPGRPDVVYAQHTFKKGPGGRKAKTGTLWLHRFVLEAERGQIIDHRNCNPLDCRRENLRLATPRQNSQNIKSSPNQKRGGFKGVRFDRATGLWRAVLRAGEVGADGRRKNLYFGPFKTAEDAAHAYDAAARQHFGEFASCNFELPSVAEVA